MKKNSIAWQQLYPTHLANDVNSGEDALLLEASKGGISLTTARVNVNNLKVIGKCSGKNVSTPLLAVASGTDFSNIAWLISNRGSVTNIAIDLAQDVRVSVYVSATLKTRLSMARRSEGGEWKVVAVI